MKKEFDSMRSEMNDVLEVLKLAKMNDGKIGKDKTMLDEKRRVTIGYVDATNKISEIKIPLDSIEIDENVSIEQN